MFNLCRSLKPRTSRFNIWIFSQKLLDLIFFECALVFNSLVGFSISNYKKGRKRCNLKLFNEIFICVSYFTERQLRIVLLRKSTQKRWCWFLLCEKDYFIFFRIFRCEFQVIRSANTAHITFHQTNSRISYFLHVLNISTVFLAFSSDIRFKNLNRRRLKNLEFILTKRIFFNTINSSYLQNTIIFTS